MFISSVGARAQVVASSLAFAALLTACGGGDVAAPGSFIAAVQDPTQSKVLAAITTGSVVVRARATLASNIGPQMELRVDGVVVGSTEVRSVAYTDYTFSVAPVPAGARVDIVFNNDKYENGEDRNLFVESLTIGSAVMTATDAGVTFDRGGGSEAFDGIDVLPGLATLYWNGALRFTVAGGPVSADTNRSTYQASNEDFPNPERGFAYENDVAWAPSVTWDFCGQGNNYTAYNYTAWNDPLQAEFLKEERRQGRSVVSSRYHIADFRNRDLTPAYLTFLQKDFDTVRQSGMKMQIRFAYNYPMGGPDAPIVQILRHLDQLKPLLRKNVDVIAFVGAGFIGCWGEWHHSSNGLVNDNGGVTEAQKQLMDKWLEVLPPERMVAMRYPYSKFGYLGNADLSPVAPLTVTSAFNGSKRSRVASEDDCPVCSESHGSGYWNPRGDLLEAPNFMRVENLFVVQGGEPGDPESIDPAQPANPDSPLSACPRVTEMFKNLHWSVMGLFNLNSPASAIKRWERDGCLEDIKQRLGYRYRMISSNIPSTTKAGGNLPVQLEMANDGWANLYNPRSMEIVLRSTVTGKLVPLTVYSDARLRLPFPSTTKTLDFTLVLPVDVAAGTYDVLVHLPDPTATLYGKPEYSIRLANLGMWEPVTGFNRLSAMLNITP